jgi:hypothetical protein
MPKKRTRPPEQKVYRYVVHTGTPNAMETKMYESVSQARGAVLRFFESFEDSTFRLGTKDEKASLLEVKLRVAREVIEAPLFPFEARCFQWGFQWGTTPMTVVARVEPATA